MNKAQVLDRLLKGARASRFGLFKLNFALLRVIPFNKPHGLKVQSISDEEIFVQLPFRKRNLNHLKGIHACAIATIAEYTSGLLLLDKASSSGYRIIMKSIHVEYHYQAKSGVIAHFKMSDADFSSKVSSSLEKIGVSLDTYIVEVHDQKQNHIATASIKWQLKDWKKTKTNLA